MSAFDAVEWLERVYDLEADEPGWLRGLVHGAMPAIDRGFGIFAMTLDTGGYVKPRAIEAVGDPRIAEMSAEVAREGSSEADEQLRRITGYSTVRRVLSMFPARDLEIWDAISTRYGVKDAIGVVAHDGEQAAIQLLACSARVEDVTRADAARWVRLALHAGSAFRVRARKHTLDDGIEAVLTPRGRVEHASGALRADARALDALGEGTREMLRARGPLRKHEDEALDAWPSMVRGRWTLATHTERDGKHLVHAHENLPRRVGLAALTPRERAVVELVRRGHGNKQIAYALGLSAGTVAWILSSAMRRLGVRSRVGLVGLADAPDPGAVRAVLAPRCSEAEIAVAVLVVAGLSNEAIAEARGTAPRTVANQLARLFEKLSVRSRAQLAARVQALLAERPG